MRVRTGLVGVIFVLFGAYMIWQGAQEAYVILTNSKATEISCRDYMEKGSSAVWLNLTRCQGDYTKALFIYEKNYREDGPYKDLYRKGYVPLWPAGEKPPMLFKVVKEIKSQKTIQMLETYDQLQRTSHEAAEEYKKTKLLTEETLKGMVMFGAQGSNKVRQQLVAKLKVALAPDFVLIEEGRRPEGAIVFAGLIVGLFFFLLGLGVTGRLLGLGVTGRGIFGSSKEEVVVTGEEK